MGATEFSISQSASQSIEEAFRAAVRQAQYEYGHGGYTGTIAEKESYVLFAAGRDFGQLPFDTVYGALGGYAAAQTAFLEAHPDLGSALREAQACFDDKWGPAVAFRFSDEWVFCGKASS